MVILKGTHIQFTEIKMTSINLVVLLHVKGSNNLHTNSRIVLPSLVMSSIFLKYSCILYPVLSLDAACKLERRRLIMEYSKTLCFAATPKFYKR